MITYVNTVLVSNKNGASLATKTELAGVADKADLAAIVGKFAFMNCDPVKLDGTAITDIYAVDNTCKTFKIGVVTSGYTTKVDDSDGSVTYIPVVKWSNEIKAEDVKNTTALTYKDDSEDKITIDFTTIDQATADLIALGGIALVLRLTWKDLPTRYRNWTDSYDYYTKLGDDATAVAAAFAKTINKQSKRARVVASAASGVLTLEALPYDDDLADDSENPVAKVRFNANMYFKNPQATGFASSNKYELGAKITKEVGVTYPASAKLVRQQERNSWGYLGAIHRNEWYDKKPALVANIDYKYGGATIEFENMYRAADDIFRKTKQTVEIYASNNGEAIAPASIGNGLLNSIVTIVGNSQNVLFKIDNKNAYDPENYAAGD